MGEVLRAPKDFVSDIAPQWALRAKSFRNWVTAHDHRKLCGDRGYRAAGIPSENPLPSCCAMPAQLPFTKGSLWRWLVSRDYRGHGPREFS